MDAREEMSIIIFQSTSTIDLSLRTHNQPTNTTPPINALYIALPSTTQLSLSNTIVFYSRVGFNITRMKSE